MQEIISEVTSQLEIVTTDRPQHVAIIMDGNGRWASRRFLPRVAGHRAGVESVRETVTAALELGVRYLTLFAFSSENWRRPPSEVRALMSIFYNVLEREARRLHEKGVRLNVIGERSQLDKNLQDKILEAEQLTLHNTDLQLNIAVNFGGRWDILQAVRKLAARVQSGTLQPDDLTEKHISAELSLSQIPEPDLFIRTSGEQRISNFLIWDMAYTELYFTDLYWPDFDKQAFYAAIKEYAQRQRRFGYTSEQIEHLQHA